MGLFLDLASSSVSSSLESEVGLSFCWEATFCPELGRGGGVIISAEGP